MKENVKNPDQHSRHNIQRNELQTKGKLKKHCVWFLILFWYICHIDFSLFKICYLIFLLLFFLGFVRRNRQTHRHRETEHEIGWAAEWG